MKPTSQTDTYRSLQALPTELLLKLKQEITDFSSHLAFSLLCSPTRRIYTEDCFRNVCLDAGFGKPDIWRERSWTEIAYVYDTASETPHVRIIPELRASIGAYDIDWETPRKECAAIVVSRPGSGSGHTDRSRCLHKHITLAARLITNNPIRNIKLAFEGDQSWAFVGFAGFDPKRIPRTPSYAYNQRPGYTSEELVDYANRSRGFRTTAYNKNGLTCHDLLSAAANIPGMICSVEDGEFLVFAGILDDQIRRGVLWVQAQTPPFSSSRALRSLPP